MMVKITTKQWILIAVVIIVAILIGYAIKVTIDKNADAQKKLLYQNQLNNLNIQQSPNPPFLTQVLSTFVSLYSLGI